MTIVAQPFRDTYVIAPRVVADGRGRFLKTFHEGLWKALGVPAIHSAEEFWSISAQGVLRGMHFQVPPHDHDKVVTCLAGRVLDVVLDLRTRETTFGSVWSGELSGENGHVLVLPKGVAHGFLALENNSLMHYKVSTVHDPACDRGVRWDSFGFRWPEAAPNLSPRDSALPALASFASPW